MLSAHESVTRRSDLSNDRVIPVDEAARIAGVSASTLKRRAIAGELTIIRLSPRRIGIRLTELSRWLDVCAALGAPSTIASGR